MNVTAVLLNFRDALLALVPVVERVGIAWRRPEAYDEWDAIANALFDNLVAEVLRWSVPENSRASFQLPSYDLLLPTYAGLGTLEVAHSSLGSGRWLFHAFGSRHEPFDIVEVRPLSEHGKPLSDELQTCPVDGARFLLRPEPEADAIEGGKVADE